MLNKHPQLLKALNSFAKEYSDNPYKYIYETDVQVLLSNHLEKVFSTEHIITREINSHNSLADVETFNIGKVHREYPSDILFDNVVLGDPQQRSQEQKDNGINYESFYTQPIKYAIELKLVPLYVRGVVGADKSMDDYARFVNIKLSKLLAYPYNSAVEYGLQLTVLQSIEEQEDFLKNHRKEHRRRKWEGWFDEFYKLAKDHPQVGYYYLDLMDGKIKSVLSEITKN